MEFEVLTGAGQLIARCRISGPRVNVAATESNIAHMIAGTPAITNRLPMRKPGAAETGLSISRAPRGIRAIRRRPGDTLSALP